MVHIVMSYQQWDESMMIDTALSLANVAAPALRDAFSRVLDTYLATTGAELEEARVAHERARRANATDPLLNAQDRLIALISATRNEIMLCVSEPDFQQKLLALLTEQLRGTYRCTDLQLLAIINSNVEHLRSAVQSYRRSKLVRARVRIAAVLVSIFGLIALGVFLWWAPQASITSASKIPLLELPVPVLLWSVIGSFAAILYRFSTNGDAEISDPLRWLFSRPLTGIIIGSITYLIIQVGVVTLAPESATAPVEATALGSNELIWLIAFLAGFSDRFADRLLSSSVGRFGGDGALVSTPAPSPSLAEAWYVPVLPAVGGLSETTTVSQVAAVTSETRVSVAAPGMQNTNGSPPQNGVGTTREVPSGDVATASDRQSSIPAVMHEQGTPSVTGHHVRERLRALAAVAQNRAGTSTSTRDKEQPASG